MSKSMPLFGGVIKKVAKYKDTNTVKVIVQLRQIGLNGADIDEMQDLEEWQHVCFRLPGLTYLENLGKELTESWRTAGHAKPNEEVAFVPGRYIYFTGVGPSKWDGKSEYDGHQLLKMIVVVPESISGRVSTAIQLLKIAKPKAETGDLGAMVAEAAEKDLAAITTEQVVAV